MGKLFSDQSVDPAQSGRGGGEPYQPGVFGGLPIASPRAKLPVSDAAALTAQLAKQHQEPVFLLKDVQRHLTALNRAAVKPERRLEFVDAALRSAYAAVARLVRKFHLQQSGGQHSAEEQNALRECLSAVDAIIVGYKLVFRDDYPSSDSGAARNRLLQCGFRLLEVLRLEQRVRALRYQKLPAKSWRDVNQAYVSLLTRRLIDEELELTGTLGIAAPDSEGGKQVRTTSPRQLYVSIQLFGLLDPMTWPRDLMHMPDAYFSLLKTHIHVRALPRGSPLAEGCVVIYADSDAPPSFQQRKETTAPALFIDLLPLQVRLAQDRKSVTDLKQIGALEPARLPKPLAAISEADVLPVLDAMQKGFQARERRHVRRSVYGGTQLRLYMGYRETYRLLLDYANGASSDVMRRREFVDALAGQSAMLAEDQAAHLSRQWSIMDESDGGLRVSTDESDFTQDVQVGMLVALCAFQEANSDPELGYIARLHRPREGQLDLGVVRLSRHAEAAVVQDNQGQKAQTGRPAILIRDIEGDAWRLILSSRDAFGKGAPLLLTRGDSQHIPLRLGEPLVRKRGFEVFEFRAPGM
ncbi:MAG TPA: hypothetical protein VKA50_11610 [Gammaproteobacteria bacterium]|nr:hypothetical protein [Gammaproteobacteria bacterium]